MFPSSILPSVYLKRWDENAILPHWAHLEISLRLQDMPQSGIIRNLSLAEKPKLNKLSKKKTTSNGRRPQNIKNGISH
jgi:hypothetical protein